MYRCPLKLINCLPKLFSVIRLDKRTKKNSQRRI